MNASHAFGRLALLSCFVSLAACKQDNRDNDQAPDRTGSPDAAQHPPELIPSFTDHVPSYWDKKIPFKMVLIPGNPAEGIKPFYIGKTEVTWAMFEYWVYGGDKEGDWEAYIELMRQGLRPSSLGHGHPQVDQGLISNKNQPAVGMSWRVAQAYCRWLSEQTGRAYRLPTDNEWRYVLEQSGGVPADTQSLLEQALLADNAEWDDFEFFTQPRDVAQGKPNKLGLYDLLGNAAEWVQPAGGKRWVRGGHFVMEAKELTGDWHSLEDQAVWNESYPAIPYSRSWYIDHYYQGIRLVCAIEVDPKELIPSQDTRPSD